MVSTRTCRTRPSIGLASTATWVKPRANEWAQGKTPAGYMLLEARSAVRATRVEGHSRARVRTEQVGQSEDGEQQSPEDLGQVLAGIGNKTVVPVGKESG